MSAATTGIRNTLRCIRFFSTTNSTGDGTQFSFNPKQPILWSEYFRNMPKEERTKAAFLKCIEMFRLSRGKRGGGHVEFIEAAMKNMQTYNLHKDLDIYKALLDVFPKGDLIPKNMFQRMFWHFPQQQHCALRLLDQMEWHGVQPDKDLNDLMGSIFGDWNFATKKVKRQLYWLPKLKHTNKYLDRRLVEGKQLANVEMARIALKMICRDAGTQLSSFKAYFAEEGTDHNNWIVSAQSPLQKRLIANLPDGGTCHVDGPSRVWVREHMLTYVTLSCAPSVGSDEEFIDLATAYKNESEEELHQKLYSGWSDFRPNLHQQSDQTILALAIFGVNSNEFASAWIHHLQEENPHLCRLSVLFRLKEIRRSLYKVMSEERNNR